MSQIIYFSVNGQTYYTNYKLTLFDLISYLNYNETLFVVELNQLICNKNKWHQILITDHDQVEIISIVGGG